jgi:hypothetical protein
VFFCQSCHILPDVDVYFTQESPLKYSWSPRGVTAGMFFPKISLNEAETIKNALLPHGTIPDGDSIDQKACLLAIYHHLITARVWSTPSNTWPILISPMRRTRAARLTFNCEYCFEWRGWWETDTLDEVETSHVIIENNSWTWYV